MRMPCDRLLRVESEVVLLAMVMVFAVGIAVAVGVSFAPVIAWQAREVSKKTIKKTNNFFLRDIEISIR